MTGQASPIDVNTGASLTLIDANLHDLRGIRVTDSTLTLDQVNAYLKTHEPGPFTIVTVGPKELKVP